ncbi:MAG: hypothetical protein JW941_07435 [Candidatus Coatesbacteria bacterium]|nr:hypothetical protein [Candidatus Coatesbacteria bacterium]
MSLKSHLKVIAPWALFAVFVLTVAALQLTDFGPPRPAEPRVDIPIAINKGNSDLSLREFINSCPAESIVIVSINGRPSKKIWEELESTMIRIGAQREINLVWGASLVIIGVMDAKLGSAAWRMGVQEIGVEIDEGDLIGKTGVRSPCKIVARSIGDSEGIGRSIIAVNRVASSPNEPGVNVVVLDRNGKVINRGVFE